MADDFFSYQSPPGAPSPAPASGAPVPRLLAELGDEDWERFIGFTARRRYPDGAEVLRPGQGEVALYFVAAGRVRVELPGAPVDRRGEGEVIGLLSFLDRAPAAARVVVEGEAELLMLTADALQRLGAWQPRIALALLRDLAAHAAARLRRLQPGD
jgi:CRP-like cAMP-binding protein